jgi:hypothetical protein
MFSHPRSPEVDMKASRRETIRYRRLFPVFTAANPIRRVVAM